MSNHEDNLVDNPFWQVLQAKYEQLFDDIAGKPFIICCPTAASMTLCNIDRSFIYTHILKSSPYYEDEFVTLNNEVVLIKNKEILTRQGFRESRCPKIIYEETYYDENFVGYRVVRLSYPLVGKLSSVYMKHLNKQVHSSVPIANRTQEQHDEFAQGMLTPLKYAKIIAKIADFCQHFQRSYVMVKGMLEYGCVLYIYLYTVPYCKLNPGQRIFGRCQAKDQ